LNATDAARTALKTLEKDAPAQSQAYHQAIRAQANAEMDHHDAYDEYNKNPSADTLRKLDEAGVKRAQATKALEAARQDLIDHATPEHQAAGTNSKPRRMQRPRLPMFRRHRSRVRPCRMFTLRSELAAKSRFVQVGPFGTHQNQRSRA
jgi:hypothetical protein